MFCGVDVIRWYVMLSHVIALLSGRVNLLCSVILLGRLSCYFALT